MEFLGPYHTVKSWTFLFQPIFDGRKTHDLRKDDRTYRVGDRLLLREYDMEKGAYTRREAIAGITFITNATTPCALSSNALAKDHAILSIKLLARTDNATDDSKWPMDSIELIDDMVPFPD
jgi:hypothetical protein